MTLIGTLRKGSAPILVALVLFTQITAARDQQPLPDFKGKAMPVAPEQKSSWDSPATKLPKVLVSAIQRLFEQGLADPRGCQYGEVEVGTGSCWSGDAGIVKTHGWILPKHEDDNGRFAVCWNGLVYPVVSVGEKSDLRADVLAIVKADEEMRAKRSKERPDFPFHRFRQAWSEPRSVSHQSILPLKVCLLLRLGEPELAEKVWEAWTAGMRPNTNDDDVHLKDPYLMLATDWTWALFDRAVCAHMRGDDRLALLSAQMLMSFWKSVEEEADRRGFQKRSRAVGDGDEPYHLGFLQPAKTLLVDQERRAKQPSRKKVLDVGLDKFPDKADRIAALILDLEEVSARQSGQPGGVSLSGDPIIKALTQQGEEAVEPLLECFEKDDRLTRSVGFGRDFRHGRNLIGVHGAAYVALSGILKDSLRGVTGRHTEDRKAAATKIREYWNQYKGTSIAERWYRVLADDNASPEQWLESATRIVQPDNERFTPGSLIGTSRIISPLQPGERPRMRGESLRQKKNPSVAELMAKRVRVLNFEGRPGSSSAIFRMHNACDMAVHLGEWDAKAELPTLRWQARRCREVHHMTIGGVLGGWTSQILARYFAQLIILRAKAGDDTALKEYASWIKSIRPEQVDRYVLDVFEPMWKFPNDPSIEEAAVRLFGDPASPWHFAIVTHSHKLAELLETPLIRVAGFRERWLAGLDDRSRIGSVEVGERGLLSIEIDDGWGVGTGSAAQADPLVPKPGTKSIFRMCDFWAWKLSRFDGTPRFELYWPESRQDEVLKECSAFVRRFGKRYSEPAGRDRLFDPRPRLTFPVLNRPATAAEVEQGLAIFSFEPNDTVRTWKLPTVPVEARWTTLKDYPRVLQSTDARTGKPNVRIEYEQKGNVWQAEEVLRDGKWHRYYGFVGRYTVAKVPAAEIEFPTRQP